MPASRQLPEVFSTSFLDLLSCGLAGVIILWLLAIEEMRSAPVETPRAVFLQLAQRGMNHIKTVKASCGGVVHFDGPLSDQSLSWQCSNGTRVKVVTRSEMGEFAGGFLVTAEDVSDDVLFQLGIEPCDEDVEIHYLELTRFAEGEATTSRYVYQMPNRLAGISAALATPSLTGDDPDGESISVEADAFHWMRVPADPNQHIPIVGLASNTAVAGQAVEWNITIGSGGNVLVTPPPEAAGAEKDRIDVLISNARLHL